MIFNMKKVIYFLILCIISVGVIGCSKQNRAVNNSLPNVQVKKQATSNEIIQIVYNQLPKKLKETIDFDLKEIKINKVILKSGMGKIDDKSYIGKEIYDIEFTIKDKYVRPNNRIVFATLNDYQIIGYGYVD